jgi:hypothetical protein
MQTLKAQYSSMWSLPKELGSSLYFGIQKALELGVPEIKTKVLKKQWVPHMFSLISGQGWVGADGKEEGTANSNSCHTLLYNLMFWDQLGSVAQLGAQWHISMLVDTSHPQTAVPLVDKDASEEEKYTTLWIQDSLICLFPFGNPHTMESSFPGCSDNKGIKPHCALVLEVWIYQALRQTEQPKYIIWVKK